MSLDLSTDHDVFFRLRNLLSRAYTNQPVTLFTRIFNLILLFFLAFSLSTQLRLKHAATIQFQ